MITLNLLYWDSYIGKRKAALLRKSEDCRNDINEKSNLINIVFKMLNLKQYMNEIHLMIKKVPIITYIKLLAVDYLDIPKEK